MFRGGGGDVGATLLILVFFGMAGVSVYVRTSRTVGSQFARLLVADLILVGLALVLVPLPWNLAVIGLLTVTFAGLHRLFLVKTFPTFTLEQITFAELPTELSGNCYAMQVLGFTPSAAFRMNRAGGVNRFVMIMTNPSLHCYGKVSNNPGGPPFVSFFTVLPGGRLLTNRIGGGEFPYELIQKIDAPMQEMFQCHLEAVQFARGLHAVIVPADPDGAAEVYRHNFESEQQWVASLPAKKWLLTPLKPRPAPPIVTNPDAPATIGRFSAG